LLIILAAYAYHLKPIFITEGGYYLLVLQINRFGFDFFVIMMHFGALTYGVRLHIELFKPRDLRNLDWQKIHG